MLKIGTLVLSGLLLDACGNTSGAPGAAPASGGPSPSDQAKPTAVGPDSDETATPTPDGKPTPTLPPGMVLLEIGTATGAKDFKYTKETLEAPAGSKIRVRFVNNTNPKDEVGHNWVLVKPGQEDNVVANGLKAGDDKDWLDVKDPGIIARTRLIEGGEKDTITFAAPEPGTYTYLSTFPDQYAGGMKGTLIVK